MLVSKKAWEATKAIFFCIVICAVMAVSIWACKLYAKRVFSPPEPGAAGSTSVAPVQYKVKARMEQK